MTAAAPSVVTAGPVTRELVVTARTDAADAVIAVELAAPDGADLPVWEPGAHIDVRCGELVRQYSLCGDPQRDTWRIAVLREPAGRGGSQWVHDTLQPGSVVEVTGPRNRFPLVDAARYLFLAGGIGITPILPMVRAAAASGAQWELHYGGRTRAAMAFADELAAMGEPVHLYPQDETGLLPLDELADHAGGAVYCCGPEPLLAAAEQRWGPDVLHLERFTADADTSGDAFEVELANRGVVVPVRAGCTILETLEQHGLSLLSSCREGTCGTCETAVLGGVPDHRDVLLTPDEQAANDTMMICVSRALTPRLVLDI